MTGAALLAGHLTVEHGLVVVEAFADAYDPVGNRQEFTRTVGSTPTYPSCGRGGIIYSVPVFFREATMANKELAGKILKACERFERGEISVADLQAIFEANAFALVGLDKSVYSRLHEFDNALERIQFSSPLQARYQETSALIKEIREFLRGSVP